jgi:hypothetical protein
MIMRFQPANIRLINRRSSLPRLLLALPSKNDTSNRNGKNTATPPLFLVKASLTRRKSAMTNLKTCAMIVERNTKLFLDISI